MSGIGWFIVALDPNAIKLIHYHLISMFCGDEWQRLYVHRSANKVPYKIAALYVCM